MTAICAPIGEYAPVAYSGLSESAEELHAQLIAALVPRHREAEIVSNIVRALEAAFARGEPLRDVGVIDRAVALMRSVPADVRVPDVVIESENAIGLDWDEGDRSVVSITIDRTPRVGFSSLLGGESHYGTVEFSEYGQPFPQTLVDLLGRLYSTHRRKIARR